jgi:CspA family cold shock protein
MHKGVITFFNEIRGYGFIATERAAERPRPIYVHHSRIAGRGYRTLREGDAVTFDLRESRTGLEAVNVRRRS